MGDRMPAVFIGHGSPMNVVEDNSYTRDLAVLAASLPRPEAVLVVSAHWLTEGTEVLCDEFPRTIHDFYGFPEELYDIQYVAPGAPEVAEEVATLAGVACGTGWGLDHASWAVLEHMYPDADVPVLELSVDMTAPAEAHYALGRRLGPLRDRGVLVLGSGNLVHNLSAVSWEEDAQPYDWAVDFDAWAAARLAEGDHAALVDYSSGPGARMAVPTPDHYLPMLYVLGTQAPDEALTTTHEGFQNASVSMRCFRVG
jgi:4,5-DOPA dioxygenase extradiol